MSCVWLWSGNIRHNFRKISIDIIRIKFKFSDHVTKADDGPFKASIAPIVYLSTYKFKYLNKGKIIPEELFRNTFTEESYESEHVCNATKLLSVILYAKYEKSYLDKITETECQQLT